MIYILCGLRGCRGAESVARLDTTIHCQFLCKARRDRFHSVLSTHMDTQAVPLVYKPLHCVIQHQLPIYCCDCPVLFVFPGVCQRSKP